MNPLMTRRSGTWSLLFVVALCALFVAAEPAAAQLGGGGMRRGGGHKGRDDKGSAKPQDQGPAWQDTGNSRCRIIKFEPAKTGEEDENLLGVLKVKPIAKDAKMLRLRVRRNEQLSIELAGHQFDLDALEEIPWKGLFCEATWGSPDDDSADDEGGKSKKRKKNQRDLRSLKFETVEVEGKIVSIENDMILLKVKPKDGKEWPDIEAKQATGSGKAPAKPKKVGQRKLRLRMLDAVTSFEAGNNERLDLGDFEVDQRIEATVTCGMGVKVGIMVKLRAPDVEAEKAEGAGGGQRGGGEDRDRGGEGRGGTRRGGGGGGGGIGG
ncbi:MAG: hypothetical protein JXQ75_20520 [Phycisphaerae bacterium]|nr:hypothetical protein [Phycisphaerae bacterium]